MKEIKTWDWLHKDRVRREPLIRSGSEEREKGMGVRVWGSMTDETERERVSRKRGPV